MQEIKEKIESIIARMGFTEARVSIDEEHRKISIFIDDDVVQSQLERILPALDHIVNLILRKEEMAPCVVDVNYYRKERERLIVELARAAAHKATLKKEDVELPPMNSYERRIVHMELADKPDLQTESVGESRDRRVIIKLID